MAHILVLFAFARVIAVDIIMLLHVTKELNYRKCITFCKYNTKKTTGHVNKCTEIVKFILHQTSHADLLSATLTHLQHCTDRQTDRQTVTQTETHLYTLSQTYNGLDCLLGITKAQSVFGFLTTHGQVAHTKQYNLVPVSGR